ncbi:MAG: STAS domain-containing protein [FCB group bacterium]|nr:STAS domain-containing protein [FCB group bacterium]
MKLSHREEGSVTVIEPKGKIMGGPESTALHDLLHELIENDRKSIVVDLGKVDWMNSTGLGLLISGLTTLKKADGELKLANVTEKIQSLLTITKLVTIFKSFDTVDEAISSF